MQPSAGAALHFCHGQQRLLSRRDPTRRSGDEARYADKRASFAKTLPHNDAGEVDADAFGAFITAVTSGKADDFETIPRDRSAETELNNPQAAYAFDLVGLDSAATVLDPPPTFASAAMVSDMVEVYGTYVSRAIRSTAQVAAGVGRPQLIT